MKILDLKVEVSKKSISFQGEIAIASATTLGVYGPNGSGKSSLMKALAGVLPQHQRSGFAFVGTDMFDLSQVGAEWSKTVLYLGSEMKTPFALTLRDLFEMAAAVSRGGLHLPITSAERTRIAFVCEAMGLTHQLSRSLQEMSDGEKQWAMIARGLIQQPKLLLLDETISKLDVDRLIVLSKILKSPMTEKMCIWICGHELRYLLQVCDQILLLCPDPRIVQSKHNSPEAVMKMVYPEISAGELLAFIG